MVRKQKLTIIENVKITDIGSEGKAIAHIDNKVLFVPMLIPGDIADIKIVRKRKNWLEGIPVRINKYSSDRISAACEHFGVCGGCKWQHLPYRLQLIFKEKQVRDNLERIGKIDLPAPSPILGSPDEYLYRNKLEYTFSDSRWLTSGELKSGKKFERREALGFHIPGLFDKVLDIIKCHLQPEPTNIIRNAVREFTGKNGYRYYNLREQEGLLRNLIIRNTTDGQIMVIVVFHQEDTCKIEELLNFIREKFPEITSLMYIINPKKNDTINDLDVRLFHGIDHLTEIIGGLKFRVGPKSFYQTNTKQAAVLYDVVKKFSGLTGNELVYDLYTGTGTIACYVAGSALRVIGIEYVDEAVNDARLNAELNGVKNAFFFSGDIRQVLSENFFFENGRPDVIITDPPRAGMHRDVVDSIIKAAPRKIVYVSCNPATQARDIQLLSDYYSVSAYQPVDMFPHTNHVENVVLLTRK
jgi:23S rRNA (uracil1939-C5)-methyltransferase